MNIVKRDAFLAMPAGTVYSPYEHCSFGELAIKGETLPNCNDWYYQPITDAIEHNDSGEFADKLFDSAKNGTSLSMNFNNEVRDGGFDPPETMYAVWEGRDVADLVERLRATFSANLALTET